MVEVTSTAVPMMPPPPPAPRGIRATAYVQLRSADLSDLVDDLTRISCGFTPCGNLATNREQRAWAREWLVRLRSVAGVGQ